MILLDTHVVAWLHAGLVERFPPRARELLEREQLAISPLVCLELQYLHEIGRLSEPAEPVIAGMGRALGLRVSDCSLAALVDEATGLDWTRDPFDRLIAAHATIEQAPLLTADKGIHAHLPSAVWG